ncbi:MAG TPA: LysM peptidoglycan-binding domain-containing protein [Anaerolineaceae bacterium]|nr:LysM peptidoglycan-binding domain-containing protein [Anaerolineaceae bacterium]
MKKTSLTVFTLVTIALLVITGCTRSATRAPRATATPEGGEIPLVSTQSQIMVDILAGTQTAQAFKPSKEAQVTSQNTQAPATGGEEPAATTQTTPEPEKEIVVPTPTPGRPATYTIQKDEFPFCIARRFNVDPVELLSINGLNMDSYVVVGFTLTIPQSGSFPYERALKSHPTEYTVQAGDTIGKIACAFGDVDPNMIYAANGWQPGTELKVGDVIRIP